MFPINFKLNDFIKDFNASERAGEDRKQFITRMKKKYGRGRAWIYNLIRLAKLKREE